MKAPNFTDRKLTPNMGQKDTTIPEYNPYRHGGLPMMAKTPEFLEEEVPKKPQSKRKPIEVIDVTKKTNITNLMCFNSFNVKLEAMKQRQPSWTDPRNQHRPFKPSFLEFIKTLVLRLPAPPDVSPMLDGSVKIEFKKNGKPRDTWQILTFQVYPKRYFTMMAKSRKPNIKPFKRTNICRVDLMGDLILSFIHKDDVNTKDHPIRYRSATVIDYPVIAALAQTHFGPNSLFSAKEPNATIRSTAQYAVVAEDPIYGIVAVGCVGKTPDCEKSQFEVTFAYTLELYRGLGIGEKCVRKAITNLLVKHPHAGVMANPTMNVENAKDNCKGLLTRCGFKRAAIITCPRLHSHGVEYSPTSHLCKIVHYELGDTGGSQGYGGRKEIQ